MTGSQKIDEWIKEAETRPESATLILKLIAGRLNNLTQRNEELLAENIALQDGSRVEEYQKRIAALEYQLELLKRRFGAPGIAIPSSQPEAGPQAFSLLAWHANGRIIRIQVASQRSYQFKSLGKFAGDVYPPGELPRLLVVPAGEELLLLFKSGRVSTCQVEQIATSPAGEPFHWEQASLPDEPHGGELLVALMPLTLLPLSDFFIQVSRRGCVKKTMTTLADTVLSNHHLGQGTLQKADQPCEAFLCRKKNRLTLVTFEGRLLGLDVDNLTYSVEERLRLEPHDHVVAAFGIEPDQSLLCLTQNGKVIHRDGDMIELAKSANTRGQALIPLTRLEGGTRFIGAAALRESDGLVVLDGGGGLTMYSCRDLVGLGRLPDECPPLAFCVVPALAEESRL
jgi:DNA gyrase/topoisomerase IV subunit A